MEVRVYVDNLPFSTTAEELRLLFAQSGDVTSVNLIRDQANGQSKGAAFVTLSTQAEAQRAVAQFNASSLAGRILKVTLAKPKTAPSGYQGQLSAFSPNGREPTKVTPAQAPQPPGGYRSRLNAFGDGSLPIGLRRHGRGQRR